MCKWNKWGDRRIDPCLRGLVRFIALNTDYEILASCCGHGKYSPSLVIRYGFNKGFEIFSEVFIPRKKKFYKRDEEGVYYIPEVQNDS